MGTQGTDGDPGEWPCVSQACRSQPLGHRGAAGTPGDPREQHPSPGLMGTPGPNPNPRRGQMGGTDSPATPRGPRTPPGDPNHRTRGDPDQQGSPWWPWDPAGTQPPRRRYLLNAQPLLVRGGRVLVICAHHHDVGGPGHRQALSTGHRHGDRGFLGEPVPVPSPGLAGGRAGAYLTPQWAAVTTQFSLISDPPQKWKPLLRWQGELPSALPPGCSVTLPLPWHPPWHPAQHPAPLQALTWRETCHGQDPGTAGSPLTMRL